MTVTAELGVYQEHSSHGAGRFRRGADRLRTWQPDEFRIGAS
jgi:hypothetical protein